MSDNLQLLSVPQLQRMLGATEAQVLNLIHKGELQAVQMFDEWRVEQTMVRAFIDRLYCRAPSSYGSAATDEDATQATDSADAEHPGVRLALTPQQERIAGLLADGYSTAEIANELHVEVSTVKTHISRVLQRLGLRDRQQLVAYIWKNAPTR